MPQRPTKSQSVPEPPPARQLGGYTFRDPALLLRALTHRSLACENAPQAVPSADADNEQMEFLGDAILGMVVAEALYRLFPECREGELTRLRASLVSRKSLAEVALRLRLGDHLRLGRGEERTGGRAKPAILADACEAVIAAVYLDGTLHPARDFIDRHLIQPALPTLHTALKPGNTFSGSVGDHKSALQEHLQATGLGQPIYMLNDETGPDHDKVFHVEVRINAPLPADPTQSLSLAQAGGPTKKEAQRVAAERALAYIAALPPSP